MQQNLFTSLEAAALAPHEKQLPSEWAEEHRYLPGSVAAEPGKYRGDRVPYAAGIIDAIVEKTVEEIVVLKPAQVAYTTMLQNIIGWAIRHEPGPMLIVMPSQDEAGKIVDEQIKPMVETTPDLQTHLLPDAWAITKESLLFDTMPIYLGWAGSPQSLARRACRYVLFDEVDKYPKFSGRDAAPIPLGRKRTATYGHRARILIGSSPTTPDGAIAVAYAGCGDRRRYEVPCPHCSTHQVLSFGQVRFDSPEVKAIDDKAKRADFIETTSAAQYECISCKGVILDKHKPDMLRRGHWLSENQTIDKQGVVTGERPSAKRVGFHISGLLSPWVSFSKMAAQFVRSLGNYGAMMEFKNQWLGEVFEELDKSGKVDALDPDALKTAPPAGLVPKYAGMLIVTADVHEHRIDFVIRAHGKEQSQLVHEGEVYTFEDLTKICLNTHFQIDGSTEVMQASLMFIDAGYRTDEVYNYSQTDGRIRPTMGARDVNPKQLLSWSMPSKEIGVNLGIIHTHFYKDKLATQRRSGKWHINQRASEEYLRQMASEHKVVDRETGRSVWKKISPGAANHRFDLEVYQLAAADFAQTHLLPDEAAQVQMRAQAQAAREGQPRAHKSSWLGNTQKWL